MIPEWDAFAASVQRPAAQTRLKKLLDQGFHRRAMLRTASGTTSANSKGRTPPARHHRRKHTIGVSPHVGNANIVRSTSSEEHIMNENQIVDRALPQ